CGGRASGRPLSVRGPLGPRCRGQELLSPFPSAGSLRSHDPTCAAIESGPSAVTSSEAIGSSFPLRGLAAQDDPWRRSLRPRWASSLAICLLLTNTVSLPPSHPRPWCLLSLSP